MSKEKREIEIAAAVCTSPPPQTFLKMLFPHYIEQRETCYSISQSSLSL